MREARILTKKDLNNLMKMPDIVDSVREAYAGVSVSPGHIFTKNRLDYPADSGSPLQISAGIAETGGNVGISLARWSEAQRTPEATSGYSSTLLMVDKTTGHLVAVLDGTAVTSLRCSATASIATRYLAPAVTRNIFIAGSGPLAAALLRGAVHSLPHARNVCVASRDPQRVDRFILEQSPKYLHVRFTRVLMHEMANAVSCSHIVMTCTSSHHPFLRKDIVSPGTLIIAAGADHPDKQEIDVDLSAASLLFADSRVQAIDFGEFSTVSGEERIRME
ncbi:MAG: hypothetical protein U9R40_01720, partial [Synergistota bacterium]|nr:hypothetical protein [Synergistota bacterium]